MPARREIIRILPEKASQPCLVRDFPCWWDRVPAIRLGSRPTCAPWPKPFARPAG